MPSKTGNPAAFSEEPPTSIDPYEVLSVNQDATEDQIKKAYRKAALKHHPDKASGADAATAKEDFQKVAFAYAILSDARRRKRYDATGSTLESVDIEDDEFDWTSYFRAQYEVITKEAIDEFTKEYKASDEERQAILEAYMKGKGNMDVVYETVMASNVLEDDDRFRSIIDKAIVDGEVESFNKYTEESDKSKMRRIHKAEREAREAKEEQVKQKNKGSKKGTAGGKAGDQDSLSALIAQRSKSRATSGFLDALEDKYRKLEEGNSRSKKRAAMDEPPEEAFAAVGERMKKSRGRKR